MTVLLSACHAVLPEETIGSSPVFTDPKPTEQTVTPFDRDEKIAERDAYLKEYWEQQNATEPSQP